MTTASIGRRRSFAISGMPLSLVLMILLPPLRSSGGGGVLGLEEDESGQIMDGLPYAHRDRLEMLTTVLAMDKQWSAVRSEKLKPSFAVDYGLVKEFCPTLPDFEDEMIDAIDTIKKILEHCPYSGMHVEFAARTLALSAQCLLHRHARIQLTIVTDLPYDATEQFAYHFQRLVVDYQLIINRMASLGAKLHPLIALARYFDKIGKQWVTYAEHKKNNSKYDAHTRREAVALEDLLEKFEGYCAVTPTFWYDQDSKDKITLNMNNIEPKFNEAETDDLSTSTLPENEIPTIPKVRKAHKLRLILLKEFDKLLLGKLQPEVWKLIFENNILVRPIDSKPPKSQKKKCAFKNLFFY